MKIKTNIQSKTQCIGSFHNEVTGQFQYAGKKGAIYLFNFEELTDAGIVVSNVLTGEKATIPEADVVKMKTLDGHVFSFEKYDVVDAGAVVMAIMGSGVFECHDNGLNPIKLTGVSITGTVASFTGDSGTYSVADLFKKVGEGDFGK